GGRQARGGGRELRAAFAGFPRSRSSPDPFLAAGVDLFLPERDRGLEGLDRLAAGVDGGRPVWRRDGDDDARLADFDPAEPVMYGDRAQPVPLRQLVAGPLEHRRGDLLVGLALDVEDGALARAAADSADEARDRAGLRILDLAQHGCDVERPVDEPDRAPAPGRDQCLLVAVLELVSAL